MISVVLPTYNGQKYIEQSIDSVINQTYKNWELIVIDDCSTDDTNDKVKQYVRKDNRIKLIKNSRNLKLPASLNKGFSLAKGDFLTWTSDDNLFKPDALEVLVGNIINSNADLVFSAMDIIDSNNTLISKSYGVKDVREIYYRNIVGACFMYTRDVYERIGEYNEKKFLVEDYDYWLRIAKHFKLKYIPESLYMYRSHSESLTEIKNAEMQKAKIELLTEQLRGSKSEFDDEIRAKIYSELALSYFSINDFTKMNETINKYKNINGNINEIPFKVKIAWHMRFMPLEKLKRIYKSVRRKHNG